MDYFFTAVFFIFGTVIGSFLNVCAYRVPKGESIAYPASHCPSCGEAIHHIDNIPIVSYLILGGKCRSCGSKISLKYPTIELLTGVLWAVTYSRFGFTLELGCGLFFITMLIVLSAIDYDIKIIPNKVLIPAMIISALLLVLYPLNIKTIPLIENLSSGWAIGGFLVGGGLLYLIAVMAHLFFKKDAMGGGDIKLAAFIGLYLGGYVLLALFISFALGAIVGMVMISRDKKSAKEMIPFGPFMAAGSILTIFFGPQLWMGYLNIAGLS